MNVNFRIVFSHITALEIHRHFPNLITSTKARTLPSDSVPAETAASLHVLLRHRSNETAFGSRLHLLTASRSQNRVCRDAVFHLSGATAPIGSLQRFALPCAYDAGDLTQEAERPGRASQAAERSGGITHAAARSGGMLQPDEHPSRALDAPEHGTLVVSPEFALTQIAATGIGRIPYLLLCGEALGTYQSPYTGTEAHYNLPALTTPGRFSSFLSTNHATRGASIARTLLPYMVSNAASHRETQLALLFGLPRHMGGYGLGIPVMNREIELTGNGARIARRKTLRLDLSWRGAKLDLEYQSAYAHQGERARIDDSRRANALKAQGWSVIWITPDELESTTACDAIAKSIRKIRGMQPRYNLHDFDERNRTLRWELGLHC